MFYKVLIAGAVLVFAGVYFYLGYHPAQTRTIREPVDKVYAALAASMAPNAVRSVALGNGKNAPAPQITMIRVPGTAIGWTVMAGKQPALDMTAKLEPIDGGKATRVTTEIVRHDLPESQTVGRAVAMPGAMENTFERAMHRALARFDPSPDTPAKPVAAAPAGNAAR